MSGTKAGWAKRRKNMIYDEEGKSVFHKQIGAMGGKSHHKRLFELNHEFARKVGMKGVEARNKKRKDSVK